MATDALEDLLSKGKLYSLQVTDTDQGGEEYFYYHIITGYIQPLH